MSWLNCNWLPCVFVQPDSEYTVVSKHYCVQTMKAFELISVVLSSMSLSLGALEKSWKRSGKARLQSVILVFMTIHCCATVIIS